MTKRLWAQYHALLGDLEPEELEAFAIWREVMIEEDLYDGWFHRFYCAKQYLVDDTFH